VLLYTTQASDDLAEMHTVVEPGLFRELVRRLILLETSASTFEAMFTPHVDTRSPGDGETVGPRTIHVLEAAGGLKFVIVYRLSLDDEDVWIERLGYGF